MKAKQTSSIVVAKNFAGLALLLLALAMGFAALNEVSMNAQLDAVDTLQVHM